MQKLLPKQTFIRCDECGADILVLPDVKAMSKAISEHAKLHTKSRIKRAKIVNHLTQNLLLSIIQTDSAKLPEQVWLLVESYFGVRRVHGVALSEDDADSWVAAKLAQDPSGSFFHDTSSIVIGATE